MNVYLVESREALGGEVMALIFLGFVFCVLATLAYSVHDLMKPARLPVAPGYGGHHDDDQHDEGDEEQQEGQRHYATLEAAAS
jgi:hypothetical protein